MLFKSRQNWKGSSFITRWGEHISFLLSESAQNKDTKIVKIFITDSLNSFCIILQGVQESFGLIRIWYDNIIWIWKWTSNWSWIKSKSFNFMSESSSDSNSDSDFVTVSYFKSQIQIMFFLSDSDQVSVLDFVSVSNSIQFSILI